VKLRSSAVFVWGWLYLCVGVPLLTVLGLKLLFFFRHPAHAPRSAAMSPAAAPPSVAVGRPAPQPPLIARSPPVLPTPASAPANPQPVWLAVPPGAIATQPLKLETGPLPYESTMVSIMSAQVPDGVKAQALFDLIPRVPEEMRANTAEEAAALLRDRDYARIARPWIVNAKTHGAVLGALFADLMQRPDAVALPTLVEIAKTPDHPFAPTARDNLTLLVGHDFGIDWPAWDKAVLQRLNAPAATQ
jgi:hypothetical protein